MGKGYAGAILRVNLTDGKISKERVQEGFVRKFLGGKGFGAKILYDEVRAQIDPFSPENKIVISNGPLTGTGAFSPKCSAQLSIQGPKSFEVLQKLTPVNLSQTKYYWFVQGIVDGVQAIISRTGYTGEDGFELYFRQEYAIQIWEDLMAEGKCFGIKPIGLGARDTLRLEMAFPLYGHELDSMTTPLEAGLERIVDFRKGIFIGKEVLLKQKAEGLQRKLVGFRMAGEGIPRARYEVYKVDKKVGMVTSRTMSPTLRNGIGLGYVKIEDAWERNEISIMIRRKVFPAEVVRIPIYKKSLTPIYQIGKGGYHGIALQENCTH